MQSLSIQNKDVSVILSFTGTAEQGFFIDVKICKDQKPIDHLNRQKVPAVPELESLYKEWQKHHVGYGRAVSRLELPNDQVVYSSADDCIKSADSLISYLSSNWFNQDKFQYLKEWIRSRALLKEDDSVPVFFEFRTDSPTQDTILRRLPWPSWDLFGESLNTEPVLGMAVGEPVNPEMENIKVLIVLGSDEGGLELEEDEKFVSNLSQVGAKITCLSRPEAEELYSELKNNPYDIFFFAGHSFSEEDQHGGTILLKPGERLPIRSLRDSLKTAAKNGLRLAIFNSCDGLGIADTLLRKAQIPSVLVFREPVPDEVARKFLQCFLEEFAHGKPLFLSVREARTRLQFLETRHSNPLPNASWLPVVCQNYSQPEIFLKANERGKQDEPDEPDSSNPRGEQSEGHRRKPVAGLLAAALGAIGVISLLGWGGFHLIQSFDGNQADEVINNEPTNTDTIDGTYSTGEEQLLGRSLSLQAEQAVQLAHDKFINADTGADYGEAALAFIQAINQISDADESGSDIDPELMIYFNNSIAKMRGESHTTIGISFQSERPNEAREILRGVAQAQSSVCGVEKIKQSLVTETLPDCSNASELYVIKLSNHRYHGKEDAEVTRNIQELARDQSVLGIVARLTSGVSFFVEENFLAEEEIVLISPTSTANRGQVNATPSGFLFRPSPLDSVSANNLVSLIDANVDRNILIIWDEGSVYSKSILKAFENRAELSQANIFNCDISNPQTFEVDQCFRDIEADDIDILLAIPSRSSIERALNVIRTFKNDPNNDNQYKLLGGDPFYNPSLVENFSEELDGMVIPLPWHRNESPNPFERRAEILWGTRSINWRTAMAHDSVEMLIQATEQLACDEPIECRLKLRNVLMSTTPTQGATGNLKFDENGDRILSQSDVNNIQDNIGVLVEFDKSTSSYIRIQE